MVGAVIIAVVGWKLIRHGTVRRGEEGDHSSNSFWSSGDWPG